MEKSDILSVDFLESSIRGKANRNGHFNAILWKTHSMHFASTLHALKFVNRFYWFEAGKKSLYQKLNSENRETFHYKNPYWWIKQKMLIIGTKDLKCSH